jgi:flavodoxin I
MQKIGIFYGSTTGGCGAIAELIKREIGKNHVDLYDINHSKPSDTESYKNLIFGVSSWYPNCLHVDWVLFLKNFQAMHTNSKRLAMYGLGNQVEYSDSFADALGILYNKMYNLGYTIVGKWPNKGYIFRKSKALINGNFVGLVIDEDNQPELTHTKVKEWVKMLKPQLL